MKAILILSVLLVSSLALNSVHNQLMKDVFNQWKLANNKFYKAGHEEQHRFNIFLKNFNTIAELSQQDTGAELGLNKFADLTSEEFESHYLGYHKRQRTAGDAKETISLQDLPTRVDWREKGAVSGVKNQGACGSCWAFSAIGALEGLHFNNKGTLELFSEQNFVDCVQAGSAGCNGGWMTDAFDYSAKNGVELGKDYPYTARNQKCAYVAERAVRINSAYKNVTVKNVEAMKRAIVEVPVSVAIQANQAVFQFYVGGVIKALCGDKLNHGVLAVGYDTVSGHEAFIVKNSWGQNWGSKGYVFISTNGDANKGNGVCGILADAAYPTK